MATAAILEKWCAVELRNAAVQNRGITFMEIFNVYLNRKALTAHFSLQQIIRIHKQRTKKHTRKMQLWVTYWKRSSKTSFRYMLLEKNLTR